MNRAATASRAGSRTTPTPAPRTRPTSTAPAWTRTARSFENANKVCGKQIGAPAWWISGTGPPGDVSVNQQTHRRWFVALRRDPQVWVVFQWLSSPPDGSWPSPPSPAPWSAGRWPAAWPSPPRAATATVRPPRRAPAARSPPPRWCGPPSSNTVQVGGSIGYDGSFTVAAPSGVSAQQVAQAQQAVTQDQQTLSADEQAESDASTADNQAIAPPRPTSTPTVHPQLRPGQEDQGLRREGGVHAGVQPGHPDGQPGPDSADPGQPAAGDAPS